ncbi:hypothetical protein [Myroides odoratimimus]|uniref:hypothetical protein n=1 Tax=Myroides odoratimimus TaxID=76832 RepID=UPI0025783234|nr:hypothetical protein [Myroides odoratimimus]MDM1057899.1 hypothetical protein [Myroides odoratimimus]MDM1325889.1 hypothetical protein [Myroides odoratimimus]
MKTVNELRTELKEALANCTHANDNSLAAHVNQNIQWAWDNWEVENVKDYYEGQKPEIYTPEFMNDWIDNEDFDTELEQINNPA